jgi:hypothetical protein
MFGSGMTRSERRAFFDAAIWDTQDQWRRWREIKWL